MTNFEKTMRAMTPEIMAELGTKLVVINNRDVFYLTSSGQLFPTDDYQAALRYEYNWLLHDDSEEAVQSEAPDVEEVIMGENS